MVKRIKLLVENVFVYGLGGIISKIIPLLMVPIITRIIPETQYYGLSDLSSTLVSFASSLAIMGMYDAMYRMFFEEENVRFQKRVCSTALTFTLLTSLVVFALMLLMKDFLARLFFADAKYAYLVYISATATLVGATNSIIAAPTRMQNKRKIFLVTNTVGPILGYLVAVPLLLNGYYVIAMPIASLISAAILELVFVRLNHKWFNFREFDFCLLKQLLVIAVPTLPVFLIYWVFNSSDRLMISNILDPGAAGVYAVGSKLGLASQLIYTAFAGGWQFFSFSTMREQDQVKNNSLIFEYLAAISFCATAFICAWSNPFYELLFEKEYVIGYIVSPYLFLAPLLQMLFQVLANQFIIIKKTWPIAAILWVGAIFNILANLVLIPFLGIEGAAIATLLGYFISDVIAVVVLVRTKLMICSIRIVVAAIAMGTYFVAWRLLFVDNPFGASLAAIVLVLICLLLWRQDVLSLWSAIKKK